MDIRSWGLNKIMQLPDCCFGRRWIVSISFRTDQAGTIYDISEAALPEKCVIWNFFLISQMKETQEIGLNVSLGDFLPANDTQFDSLQTLFKDFGYVLAGRRNIRLIEKSTNIMVPTREIIEAGGQRLVGRFLTSVGISTSLIFGLTISSIPREVPDWLISGQGKNQF